MIEYLMPFFESDIFYPILILVIVGVPALVFFLFERQPVWYKKEQERKYVTLTLTIFAIAAIVLLLQIFKVI